MVAKQAWSLLENPDSLAGRIMKARYFLTGDFLCAEVRNCPSLVWRAIVWGRQVNDQGLAIGVVLELKALERAKSRKTVQFPHPDFGSVECLILDSPHVLLKNILSD
ncbi:hypothetical protein L3X38_038415 [Prunus dulcis]|uniref:Uncharacterized protein n=1 Tax=Prunus dulcis TaxID=3755 RepID=A0AAD4V7C7_PRUDU|nr:hypothetical protein L3X38_038415 [Prunus dulcis]